MPKEKETMNQLERAVKTLNTREGRAVAGTVVLLTVSQLPGVQALLGGNAEAAELAQATRPNVTPTRVANPEVCKAEIRVRAVEVVTKAGKKELTGKVVPNRDIELTAVRNRTQSLRSNADGDFINKFDEKPFAVIEVRGSDIATVDGQRGVKYNLFVRQSGQSADLFAKCDRKTTVLDQVEAPKEPVAEPTRPLAKPTGTVAVTTPAPQRTPSVEARPSGTPVPAASPEVKPSVSPAASPSAEAAPKSPTVAPSPSAAPANSESGLSFSGPALWVQENPVKSGLIALGLTGAILLAVRRTRPIIVTPATRFWNSRPVRWVTRRP